MPVDEGPRPVVVDGEEDDVSLADDRPDVGLVEELGDRLTGEPIVSGDPGQGLGLVRAQIAVRAGLSRSVLRLEDVAVDEDEERARLGPVREVADERREELTPDPAAADEDDPVSHRLCLPSRSDRRPARASGRGGSRGPRRACPPWRSRRRAPAGVAWRALPRALGPG